MSIKSYYRWALVLPLAVPALVSGFLLLGERVPPGLSGLVFFLYWSVLIGGIPYVLFAAAFLRWTRGRTDAQVRGGILVSPLVYAALLMICFLALLAVDGTLANSADGMWMLGAFGVLFGYGYVLLAELGRVLLRPGRHLPEPRPAEAVA